MPCIIDPELCRLLASRSPRARERRSESAETLDAPVLTASGLASQSCSEASHGPEPGFGTNEGASGHHCRIAPRIVVIGGGGRGMLMALHRETALRKTLFMRHSVAYCKWGFG